MVSLFIPTSLDVSFLEKHRNLQCNFGFVFHGFACINFFMETSKKRKVSRQDDCKKLESLEMKESRFLDA